MSIYSQTALDDGVVTGFAEEHIFAWHQAGIDPDELRRLGRAFDGPVPTAVAERLVGWQPIVIEPGFIERTTEDGVTVHPLPDRLSKVLVNPYSGDVIHIAGKGYEPDLHIAMMNAVEAATDAGAEIASAVCLGGGAHMALSFRAVDGVVLGGQFGGATPLINLRSSLTGIIATELDTGTVLQVCDNTMALAAATAVNTLKVRRTRFSAATLSAESVRRALDIAFANTEALVDELDRLAQVTVSLGQVEDVLKAWRPIPAEEGRTATLAKAAHGQFMSLLNGERNPFGQTVAGLLQAHNTWQHWSQPTRTATSAVDRLGRMAQRTALGEVQAADEKFAAIVRDLVLAT